MASSESNSGNMEELYETLYNNSYFELKKLENNTSKAKNEFRNLIRQTEMHCSFLNVDKESTDELKSQLILEYSSFVDRENQDGLLPLIDDGTNLEIYFKKLVNIDSELERAHRSCMELVETTLKPRREIPSVNSVNLHSTSFSNNGNIFSNRKPNLISGEEQSKPKGKEIFLNRNNMSLIQSKSWSRQTSFKNNGTSIPGTSINNSKYPHERRTNTFAENSLKRRANGSNDYASQYKKQNNCSNDKQSDTQAQNILKNSFLSASSMYKNPLKKANGDCKDKVSQDTESSDSSDSSIKSHPTLKNFTSKIVDIILSEIMDFSPDIKWNDIAGLEFVKSTVQEIVIWPLLRPDIFTGLRAPPRGILLFGPPGTGKTLIGKCIATESNSTFFCISASSLASKWVGESEQLVRALFAVAQLHQPAVIFIDEIDSLLSQRSDQEQDHTRKLKTEFLVQFDGAKTNSERRVLVVGATNRPHELDEAARRRFIKRLYVPLPEKAARLQIIEKLLTSHQHGLSNEDLNKICEETEGYSGSDVAHLCKEAAMGPIRSVGPEQIKTVSLDQVRPIELIDFLDALKQVRASVAQEDLIYYLDWNKKFGSFSQ